MKETFRILVKGRVQGVNFRNMTKDFCVEKNIKGTVRNLENGDVEIIAQGDDEKIKSLVDWIKSSPGFSKVENVSIEKIKAEEFDSFKIIRENFFSDKTKSINNLRKKILKF